VHRESQPAEQQTGNGKTLSSLFNLYRSTFSSRNQPAVSSCWQPFTPVRSGVASLCRKSPTGKLSQVASMPSQQFGWLTGSVLLLLAASTSPVAAQTVLFEETFANPTVTNPANFLYGIGTPPPGQPDPDPPCLTAAPLQPNPAISGIGVPGCPTDTTNAGALPDPAGTGVLRLTSSKNDQASFVLFQQQIPSGEGLIISFDFFIYNGDGADGISFFLIEGTAQPQTAGAFGGSLGYAQKTEPVDIPGLVGGYVGIGLDEFGNFSNPTEGRVGGPGFRPDSVAIRGSAGPLATGYRYLTGTGTLPGGIDNANATERAAAKRTARITLAPNNQISVDIDFGNGTFVNVIPPYDLNTAPGQADLPPTFKFGFGASTGGLRNIHEIQNLRITTVPPDLNIVKTGPDSLTVGKQASYTLRVRNSPSAGPTTGPITVTDTLPPGVNFISATGTNWNCSANASTVTCTYTGPRLLTGQEAPPITITVLPTGAVGTNTTVTNTATVTTPGDSNPEDNTSIIQTPITPAPLLSAIKTAQLNDANGNGIGDPGEVITYTIVIENRGNSPSTNTLFTDSAPANTSYVPNSTTLNGTSLPDEAGNTPLANGQLVNSPSEPLANGTVNPGVPEASTVTFQAAITGPFPPGITQIENQGTVESDQVQPRILTAPTPGTGPIPSPAPTIIPIVRGEPRLRLVKRITQVNTTPYNAFIDNPADANDDPGIWPATFQPVGLIQQDSQNPLTSGDEVEYTIYFLSDGLQPVQNAKICDAIPEGTTFIANSFGVGSGILFNQGGAQAPQTNAPDADQGTFFSPLTPVTAPCSALNNPNGSAFVQLGEVPNTAPNNVGFVRFRVKIN
jgi:uncharacterized repeat protein (TIGR01451 family)